MVSFAAASYDVDEDGSVTVKVKLDRDPERQVVIPITRSNRGGASTQDYSGVPAMVTFASDETEQEIRFTATDDGVDDDGEIRGHWIRFPIALAGGDGHPEQHHGHDCR